MCVYVCLQMKLTLQSKSILGFNLSFFAEEHELLHLYFNTLLEWIDKSQLVVAKVTIFQVGGDDDASVPGP